MLEAKSLIEIF